MNIREIENEIIEKLKSEFPELHIEGFPDKPEEFILLHPIGALLVHYQGSNYELIDRCSANFVEVEPENYAYGYHYHEINEEVFYIISGEAEVKTENGNISLKQGDAICFPSNTEKLIYIDFGTANKPDIVHFTGTGTGMVVTNSGIYNFRK